MVEALGGGGRRWLCLMGWWKRSRALAAHGAVGAVGPVLAAPGDLGENVCGVNPITSL